MTTKPESSGWFRCSGEIDNLGLEFPQPPRLQSVFQREWLRLPRIGEVGLLNNEDIRDLSQIMNSGFQNFEFVIEWKGDDNPPWFCSEFESGQINNGFIFCGALHDCWYRAISPSVCFRTDTLIKLLYQLENFSAFIDKMEITIFYIVSFVLSQKFYFLGFSV